MEHTGWHTANRMKQSARAVLEGGKDNNIRERGGFLERLLGSRLRAGYVKLTDLIVGPSLFTDGSLPTLRRKDESAKATAFFRCLDCARNPYNALIMIRAKEHIFHGASYRSIPTIIRGIKISTE